jgi:glycosyltransferase involved in cell wall biosynthesis
MRIVWSLPVRGERLGSGRGDLVRAKKLIEALQAEGHEVRVVEYGTSTAVSAYRHILRDLLPHLPAMMIRDAGRWAASLGHARRVQSQACAFDSEAIVETQVGFSFSGALASRHTGLPMILDDCSPSHEEKILGSGIQCLAKHAVRFQAKEASRIMATSPTIADHLVEEGVPREKIQLLPNGVDLKAYGNQGHTEARARMGLKDRCVIGFAGSFQPWHATSLLMRALNELRNDSRWHLLLIGDGPELESTLQKARHYGLEDRITAMGSVHPDHVPEFISCFDIGVLPGSNDYGHPMKLVEYGAAGASRIAPDLPPVRKLIKDAETGLLFKPGNLNDLVLKIQTLLNDETLRRKLMNQAHRAITVQDDWRMRARELAGAIEPFLSGHFCRIQPATAANPRRLDANGAHGALKD